MKAIVVFKHQFLACHIYAFWQALPFSGAPDDEPADFIIPHYLPRIFLPPQDKNLMK
jgi:hypothetical protein